MAPGLCLGSVRLLLLLMLCWGLANRFIIPIRSPLIVTNVLFFSTQGSFFGYLYIFFSYTTQSLQITVRRPSSPSFKNPEGSILLRYLVDAVVLVMHVVHALHVFPLPVSLYNIILLRRFPP